jgi:hypothetical protein
MVPASPAGPGLGVAAGSVDLVRLAWPGVPLRIRPKVMPSASQRMAKSAQALEFK